MARWSNLGGFWVEWWIYFWWSKKHGDLINKNEIQATKMGAGWMVTWMVGSYIQSDADAEIHGRNGEARWMPTWDTSLPAWSWNTKPKDRRCSKRSRREALGSCRWDHDDQYAGEVTCMPCGNAMYAVGVSPVTCSAPGWGHWRCRPLGYTWVCGMFIPVRKIPEKNGGFSECSMWIPKILDSNGWNPEGIPSLLQTFSDPWILRGLSAEFDAVYGRVTLWPDGWRMPYLSETGMERSAHCDLAMPISWGTYWFTNDEPWFRGEAIKIAFYWDWMENLGMWTLGVQQPSSVLFNLANGNPSSVNWRFTLW